ncbi:hypothetical protein N2152v2_008578 [Parachlorella kessleri]
MPTKHQGDKPDQQQPGRASCLRGNKRTRPEPTKVGFATGPLSDKYQTEDGHPDHEGRTAQPKRCLGQSWGHDLTPSNVKDLETELGEECRPSLDRLKRRVGLLPLRKRPQDYLTWMLDSSGSSSSSDSEDQEQQQGRLAKRRRASQAVISGPQPCSAGEGQPGGDLNGNSAGPARKSLIVQQQAQQAAVGVPQLGCPKCRWAKNGCGKCREKVAAAQAAAAAAASLSAVELPSNDGGKAGAAGITVGGTRTARKKAAGGGSVERSQPQDKCRPLAAWQQQVPLPWAGAPKPAAAAAGCEPVLGAAFSRVGRKVGRGNSDSQHVAVADAHPAGDLPDAAALQERTGTATQLGAVEVSFGTEADVYARQPESNSCHPMQQQQQQQTLRSPSGKRRLLGKRVAAAGGGAVITQGSGLLGAGRKAGAQRLGSLSDPVRKGGGVLGVVGALVQKTFLRQK